MGHEQFTQIYLPFSGKMYALAYNLLRNRDEARDCVQDVYAELWNKRDTIEPDKPPLPFVLTSEMVWKYDIFNINCRICAFSCGKICIYQKNVVPLHCSPGNSSPRLCAGEESGFFHFTAMSEFDIITTAFTAQRLSKYVAFNKGNTNQAVEHYKSNLRLAESLYISLSVFEVTLRNALSRELHSMAGKDDWLDVFYSTPELSDLVPDIDQAKKLIRHRGETVTTDKIISELTFGFWVMLLNSQYERVLWKSLRKAFPNMPKSDRKRKNVSAPCNSFRKLRNRIFHHEAICWDLDYVTCLHANLITVLGWMNADMPAWLASIDPFNNVCASIRKNMGWT